MADKTVITAAQLRAILHYNPETGVFTRLVKNPADHTSGGIGAAVGSKKPSGYLFADVLGSRYRVHRLAWLYMTGGWPEDQIDHINCDRADNRWSNLREANNQQNKTNSRLQRNNNSGFKGVYWDNTRQKYVAKITPSRRVVHLGVFDDPKKAHEAYTRAALKYFGEFART